MSNTILLVFEGETLEKQVFRSIETNFSSQFAGTGTTIIRSFFRGEIFQLWNTIKNDTDLDIVEVLKERDDSDIKNLSRNDISDVHLFFDLDPHSHPDIPQQEYYEKINNLLDTFSNEHEMGKLWISYPMAEALKHCKNNPMDCFKDAYVEIQEISNYKKLVNNASDFKDIKKFDLPVWHYLAAVNIQRAFCLVNDTYETVGDYNTIKHWFEGDSVIVETIHKKQYAKFIQPENKVVVLSSFPLFLLHYFGKSFFDECKCNKFTKNCSFSCYQ